MRTTTITTAAAGILTGLLLTGCGTVGDAITTKQREPDPTVAAPTEDPATEEPAYDDSPAEDPSVGLTAEVEYIDGTKISLDKFARGTSSEWASPASTPYVKFTIKIVNDSEATMDLGSMYVACQYGDAGKEGEQVFDTERGLEGTPTTHLRPGRSISTVNACELPKDESYVQIEVSAGWDLETAIFVGDVE
ncbi:hypothetical protein [Streptomyces sp. Ru87]|uniref:hypothetical protein n=1 Tax=Streptomyces sp. Ru87 TaxID=2044307 RepID=UPI000BF263C6|nr:hypothetical protein [Streptomyces sp. Ru87]PGH46932.1 hypothetical protein CRI70_31280 [Streptomyces sp. Ru87]